MSGNAPWEGFTRQQIVDTAARLSDQERHEYAKLSDRERLLVIMLHATFPGARLVEGYG